MTWMDGFKFWASKALLEAGIVFVIMLLFVVGCAIYVYWPRGKK